MLITFINFLFSWWHCKTGKHTSEWVTQWCFYFGFIYDLVTIEVEPHVYMCMTTTPLGSSLWDSGVGTQHDCALISFLLYNTLFYKLSKIHCWTKCILLPWWEDWYMFKKRQIKMWLLPNVGFGRFFIDILAVIKYNYAPSSRENTGFMEAFLHTPWIPEWNKVGINLVSLVLARHTTVLVCVCILVL